MRVFQQTSKPQQSSTLSKVNKHRAKFTFKKGVNEPFLLSFPSVCLNYSLQKIPQGKEDFSL